MSILTRAGKRVSSFFHDAVGNSGTAEQLIVEVAAERLSNAADKAIKRAKRGQLQATTQRIDLTSVNLSLQWWGRGGANKALIGEAVKPIVDRCKENGVNLVAEAQDGFSTTSLGSVPASIYAKFKPDGDIKHLLGPVSGPTERDGRPHSSAASSKGQTHAACK